MAVEKLPFGMGGAGGSNTGGTINLGGGTSILPTLTSTITKPINKINYPTKNIADNGLKTNLRDSKKLPNVSLSDRPKPLLEKLDESVLDAETIDVTSRSINLVINVVDEAYVNIPDITEITYPKVVRGADFVGYDVDFEISWNSVDATFIKMFIGNSTDFVRLSPKGKQSFNVKDLLERYKLQTSEDGDKVRIDLKLIPINQSGRVVKNRDTKDGIEGPAEIIPIIFDKGDIDIPRSVAINRIVEGFVSQFSNCEFDDSKYLTHLLHLGNGDNKVITTWTGLNETDSNGITNPSLILKLYEPLPSNIQLNQKVWITKLQSEPIIDTITLFADDVDYCPPLKGPNFTLEIDSGIGYQVYDDLLASGSTTNTSLVQKYISKTGIDTEKLNIEYSSGSVYTFDEYVHFGSAEERIKNFWYKIELLESYQSRYTTLTGNEVNLGYVSTEDGYILLTESDLYLEYEAPVASVTSLLEANTQLEKINNLIGTFDGFEMYLYSSTDDLAYPKSGNTIVASTSAQAIAWYNSAVNDASTYDRNNVDYLNNNLPEFIREDYQNEDFMLFMDMLGHHFDVIWAYINSLTKVKKLNQHSTTGFANELVYAMLESLGWNGKKAFDSQFLWEYALGQYKDGTQKYQQSLKSANEEVWRRILNNLPYLLKHKGTARSLKAVMACYGVPTSLLTIMEFGGPTDPTDGGTTKFTFDDRTAAINFTNQGENISFDWKTVGGTKPNAVEIRLNLQKSGDYKIVKAGGFTLDSAANWVLGVTNTTGTYGTIDLYVSESWSGEVISASTPEFNIFNDEYTQIVVNKTNDGSQSQFQIIAKESFGDRIRTNVSSSVLTTNNDTAWDSGSLMFLGYELSGSMDEFRLWKTPLEDGVIETHTLLPDSIAGNSYTASSEDLWVRFDFEYPKDRTADDQILNVAVNTDYQLSYGDCESFPSASSYPYQYTTYERTVTAKVPSLGFNSADKIRFESQELIGDLSHRVRATKKAFDRAPIDSSRLGLFFSPIKELNMDILKSFGTFNIDNYIGTPADEYRAEYSELKNVRDYYFQRLNRDIYEYIRLIRYIDKSLFDVLEELVPARAKVSKGLLIEPHFLERNKIKRTKPTSQRGDYETFVDVDNDVTLLGENNQINITLDAESDVALSYQYDNYSTNLDANDDVVLTSNTPFYNTSIDVDDETNLVGDYPTYLSEIDVPNGDKLEATVDAFNFEQIGMEPDSLANAGFGLYASLPATGSVTKLDIFGNRFVTREQIYLIKEQYTEKVNVQTKGWPATTNNEQVEYELQDVTKYRYKVSRVLTGESIPTVGNDIVEVTPLNGYFPTHYRYKNNLSQGLKYSYFEGSKQTAATTPDGLDPVETFTTNPNILRVADTGRGSGEPILEVD